MGTPPGCCCSATRCMLDTPIDAPGSGVMGFLLVMLAQDSGFPVPVGGAGQLTAALVKRARSAGAQVQCGREVSAIDVRGGRPWPCTPATAEPFACAALLSPTCRPPACMERVIAPRGVTGPVFQLQLHLGHSGGQGELRAGRADPVALKKPAGCRNRPPGRRQPRTDPVAGRPEHRDRSGPSVPAVRPDVDGRPQPFTSRDRKRLGVYAFASSTQRRRIS